MVFHKPLYQILPKHIRVFDSKSHRMPHNVYSFKEMQHIKYTHQKPATISDHIALLWVRGLRIIFNTITLYNPKKMTPKSWINYLTLIETFTGVPGMVGGMCRHLQSLRLLKHDNGWIHRMFEQAINERFHLMFFANMQKPSYFTRLSMLGLQGIFMTSFFSTYLFFPKYCHRFIGYFQQELVHIYSQLLEQIDLYGSPIHEWHSKRCTQQVAQYYHFDKQSSTLRDVILGIRADKANHRDTNQYFALVSRDLDLEEELVMIINEGEQLMIKRDCI